MESYGKFLIFSVIFIQICGEIQAATKTIDLSKNKYLPPIPTSNNNNNNNNNNANKSVTQTRTYTTSIQHTSDNFNPRPAVKTTKYPSEPSYPPLFTSYAPPPSGLVTHKNVQLPFGNSVKLPLILPKITKPNDFTKHPGFSTPPSASTEEIELENSAPMLMIEEPATVLLQPQYNKTIEAAKILASTFLEASDTTNMKNVNSNEENQTNSTDIYVVKTQKKAYIIPTQLRKEAAKPSAVDELYPLRDQFEKAYTINQFIFVIKPEKINFLNKLV